MSSKLCCSLCVTPSSEYKNLQNDVGESNEIYEITVKYFDPMLITMGCISLDESKVLCQNCWVAIERFHEFQQNVLKARTLLENTEIKQLPVVIKMENIVEPMDVIVNFKDELRHASGDDECEYGTDVKDEIVLSDNDSINSDNDSDEKPLSKIKTLSGVGVRCGKINTDSTHKKQKNRRIRNVAHTKANFDKNKSKLKNKKISEDDKLEKGSSALNVKKARESDAFISEWKPILECDLCEEASCSFDKLRSHFKEKHKSRPYIKCCERKFFRRYDLANHIQVHLDPDTHKCDICGKISANKKNLKLHKKQMHEEVLQLDCKVCHKLFKRKPSLDRHLLTHVTGKKDFACQDCGKAYVLEVQLKSHIKTVHMVDRICDKCGKTVHGIQAYKNHLMEHAGIAKPKFPCDECGLELITRSSLKRHKAALHHDGSTIYVCSICGKVTSSENALLNHKKYVHEEERKHKCTYCDKAFKRPKNLVEHIASHTGQELYQCPHCPQTFKVSSNMHHHRKKVHPVEWENGRKNRLQVAKVDISNVKNQVVL